MTTSASQQAMLALLDLAPMRRAQYRLFCSPREEPCSTGLSPRHAGDRRGRRSECVAADPTTVLIGQFVVGFGIGIDFPVSGAYVAVPKSARGRMIVATIAFQSVGMLVAAGVAMAGLTVLDQVGAWRAFFAVEAVLAGIIFLCRPYRKARAGT